MKKAYALSALTMMLFMGCQREVAFELSDEELLVKRIDESTEPGVPGKATTITDYEYNSDKKLIRSVYTSTYENITRSSDARYTRDNNGRIIIIETRWQRLKDGVPYATPEGPAFDTTFGSVIYRDASSRKISYTKHVNRSGDKTAMDSIVYEYDSNDHVKKTTGYYLPMAVHQPGEPLIPFGYTDWVFNATGSLTQQEVYGGDAPFTMQIRYRFEYDDKVNPLYRNEDAFLDQWFDISPNNVVKQTVYISANGENYDNTATYQYRVDNRPSSVAYFSPPTVVSANRQSTFYYK
jgi:hypothetical protein